MQTSTVSDALITIVNELLLLVRESEEYHSISFTKSLFQEAGLVLRSLRRRILMSSRRYVIGVVGLTNVGKSTLLNALLGNDISLTRNGPCTSVPIEFVYADVVTITTFFENRLNRRVWHCTGIDEIQRRLMAMAGEMDGHESTIVGKVEIAIPHPLLENGLVISDTPGFGAAQTDGAIVAHEDSLKEYLRKEVSQVFWVVLADQGILKREMKFFDKFFAEICDDVVVTGSEDWDEQERRRFRKRFAANLGSGLLNLHFVSGLQGLQARQERDTSGLEAAGITSLETRIRELAAPVGRMKAIQTQLHQLALDLSWNLRNYNDQRGSALRVWWRPDSWIRFCENTGAHALALEMQHNLEQQQ
jgi:GTP-binding protein EngB required for normal cell division